jgi:hypothetical protein
VQKFYSPDDKVRGGMTPSGWRDAVIAARLQIIDLNYQTFRSELNMQATSINLGTDLAALALSGAAAVASGGAAQGLAAASTGVIGAGIAFNKDTLFKQTLPAIFAQMDADRTAVLVRIRSSELTGATIYPLSAALTDITAYERAGTIETGIQALTASATNQADANKLQLAEITGLTILPADLEAKKETFSKCIQRLVDNKDIAGLQKIATALTLPRDDNIITQKRTILQALDSQVNGANATAAMTAWSDKVKSTSCSQ